MRGSVKRALYGLCVGAAVAVMMPAAAAAQSGPWDPVAGSLPASKGGATAPVAGSMEMISSATRSQLVELRFGADVAA